MIANNDHRKHIHKRILCTLCVLVLLLMPTSVFADFKVELVPSPEEGGTVTGGGTFKDGEAVTIHATPNDGYLFVGWYKEGESEPFSTDQEFHYELGEDRVYTARFEQEVKVGAIAEPADGGTVSISGDGTYTNGESVTVTATPSANYAFIGWFDSSSSTEPVSVDTSYTFAATGPVSLIAKFSPQYTLHVNISPEDTGTITGTGTYAGGSIVTLQAIPYDDYRFTGWIQPSDPNRILSTDESYTFNLEGDVTLTATFGRSYGYIWFQIGMWILFGAIAAFAVWYIIKRRQLVMRRRARAAGRNAGPAQPRGGLETKPAPPNRNTTPSGQTTTRTGTVIRRKPPVRKDD